jgi:Lsr2
MLGTAPAVSRDAHPPRQRLAVAQQTITIYTDDLDGRPIRAGKGGTVGFSLDGVDYEIDLSAGHRKALERALAPFIDNGRKVKRPAKRK